jgi:hypothetical protein
MGFDLVLKGFISDKTLIVKDYTNEILEFKTISIWIIYKKMLITLVNVISP